MQTVANANKSCSAVMRKANTAKPRCDTSSTASIPPSRPHHSYRTLTSSDYYRHPFGRYQLSDSTKYCYNHAMRTSPSGPITRRSSWHVTQSQEHGQVASNGQRRRVSTACARCRKRKIRCSGESQGGRACDSCREAGTDSDCSFFRVGSREIPYHSIDWQEIACRAPQSMSIPSYGIHSTPSDLEVYPFETQYRSMMVPIDTRDYYSSSRSFPEDTQLPLDRHAVPQPGIFANVPQDVSSSENAHQYYLTATPPATTAVEQAYDMASTVPMGYANSSAGGTFETNVLPNSLLHTSSLPHRQYFEQDLAPVPMELFSLPYGLDREGLLPSEEIQHQQQQHRGMIESLTKRAAIASISRYSPRQTGFVNNYPMTPVHSPETPVPEGVDEFLEQETAQTCSNDKAYKSSGCAHQSVLAGHTTSATGNNTHENAEIQSSSKAPSCKVLGDSSYNDLLPNLSHENSATEHAGDISNPSDISFATRHYMAPYNNFEDTVFGLSHHQTMQRESASRFERRPSAPQPSAQGSSSTVRRRRQQTKRVEGSHRQGSKKKSR